jgi:hypothetical protein
VLSLFLGSIIYFLVPQNPLPTSGFLPSICPLFFQKYFCRSHRTQNVLPTFPICFEVHQANARTKSLNTDTGTGDVRTRQPSQQQDANGGNQFQEKPKGLDLASLLDGHHHGYWPVY